MKKFSKKILFSNKMREGTQLGVDAYGVRGYIRSYRQVNLPMLHSFARFCEGRTVPSLHPPFPGASANLTAQPWPYKYGRGTRLNRLWPTLFYLSKRILWFNKRKTPVDQGFLCE